MLDEQRCFCCVPPIKYFSPHIHIRPQFIEEDMAGAPMWGTLPAYLAVGNGLARGPEAPECAGTWDSRDPEVPECAGTWDSRDPEAPECVGTWDSRVLRLPIARELGTLGILGTRVRGILGFGHKFKNACRK